MDFQTTIQEIMTTDLTTVKPHEKVDSFKDLFKKRGFHHIPVEDNDKQLVGIISTEDINRVSRFIVNQDALLAQHIMTPNPKTIPVHTPIIKAVHIFLKHQFRALPVVDKHKRFVGLITPYDLMKEMYEAWKVDKELEDMEDLV